MYIAGSYKSKFFNIDEPISIDKIITKTIFNTCNLAQLPFDQIDAIIITSTSWHNYKNRLNLSKYIINLSPSFKGKIFFTESGEDSSGSALLLAKYINKTLPNILILGVEDFHTRKNDIYLTQINNSAIDTGISNIEYGALVLQNFLKQNNLSKQELNFLTQSSYKNAYEMKRTDIPVSINDILKSNIVTNPIKEIDIAKLKSGCVGLIVKKNPRKIDKIRIVDVDQKILKLYDINQSEKILNDEYIDWLQNFKDRNHIKNMEDNIAIFELQDTISFLPILLLNELSVFDSTTNIQNINYSKSGKYIYVNYTGGILGNGNCVSANGLRQIHDIAQWMKQKKQHSKGISYTTDNIIQSHTISLFEYNA